MSKLDELIAEFCPNGVEFKPIKDEYTRLKGTPITAGKMKEIDNPNGEIRIFAGGKTVINAREEDIPKANITRVPAVLVQSRGVIDFVYYEEPFTFKNEMWAYTHKEKISVKYLLHVLKNNVEHFREAASGMGSLPQISLPVTEDFKIPVPPLEVQREIVRMLDNFTLLSAELSAELSARRKQYDYYKEEVFKRYISSDTKYLVLNEVADVRDGTHDSPKPSSEGRYLVTSKNVKNGTITFEGCYLISESDYDAINVRSKVDKWDLLFTMIGTVGEVGIITEEPQFAIKNVGLIKTGDESKSRFLKHYLTSSFVKKYVDENRSKGTQVFLGLGKLRSIPIPQFSEYEQNQIIDILDRFDILCNDIYDGLPAEINARQKQYEYYRNKLLTFKEA